MSQLQYIGARYVPIWYQNSVDQTANWEINVEYEPLTWVTTPNNHLYLSKKTVPDNIGTPAQNTDYWLDMGVITGNVQDIQDQIDAIVANMGSLNDLTTTDKTSLVNAINEIAGGGGGGGTTTRRIVVVADSYGITHDTGDSFLDILSGLLNLPSGDYYGIAEGSMGYVHQGSSGHNAQQLLTAYASNITDHDTITDIVFTCGLNDYNDTSGIVAAIDSLVSYVHSEYPKATIHMGFAGALKHMSTNQLNAYITSINLVYKGAAKNGCNQIPNIQYIMHDARNFVNDNVHPNNQGSEEIAKHIFDYLNGATPNVIKIQLITTSNNYTFRMIMANDTCTIFPVVPALGSDFAIHSSSWVDFVNLTDKGLMIDGHSGGFIEFESTINIGPSVGWKNAQFGLFDGHLYIKYLEATSSTYLVHGTLVDIRPFSFPTIMA